MIYLQFIINLDRILVMKNEEELIKYYNKFNEDKRLCTKHGQIEFQTAMKYITDLLEDNHELKIIDIGAGTGKYSIALDHMGYDVTAVELVKHNLRVIQKNDSHIRSIQGNATDLKTFSNNSFDMVLLFGPMYHLIDKEDKIKALNEAKRIVKDKGYILISYCMNEYAIIQHGFIDHHILESNNSIDDTFHIQSQSNDLYSFVRLKDINELKDICGLKRYKILAQDGPTEYIKKEINKMNDDELKVFLDYHLATCEYPELLGASRHILDILQK